MSTVTQKSNLFAGVGQKHVAEIVASATVRRVKPKEAICARGDPAKNLFVLRRGRVRYYRITKRGDEVVFRWLSPGDAFGLGSLLAHPMPYMGTAEALSAAEVLVWPQTKIRQFVAGCPQIAENAIRVVLQYLRTYADRHTRLVSKTAEERLADVLLILGHQQGHVRGKRLELEATNEQLSALADISPFTASRIMSKWEARGFIKKARGKVLITAPEALVTDS